MISGSANKKALGRFPRYFGDFFGDIGCKDGRVFFGDDVVILLSFLSTFVEKLALEKCCLFAFSTYEI